MFGIYAVMIIVNCFQASEEERKNQGLEMIELTAENKKLKAEVKAMQKSVK